TVALRHQVCPYYLAQELSRWSDLVVGDYNYWFDGSAMLYAATLAHQWRVGVLADEAHNLVERARAMYSASLEQSTLRNVRSMAPAPVRKALDKVNRGFTALRKSFEPAQSPPDTLPTNFVNALKQAT